MRTRTALLACLVLVAACASGNGFVGVEDLRMGPARYLDDSSTLLQVAGQPLHRRGPLVVSGGFEDVWTYQGFQCLMYDGWRCAQLVTTDPTVPVGRGVKVGMKMEDLLSALGTPAHQRMVRDTLLLFYDLKRRGNGFGILAKVTEDTVRSLAVGQLTFVFM